MNRLWYAALALTCWMAGPTHAEITYGTSVIEGRSAFLAVKTGSGFAVGAQLDGWSHFGSGWAFGVATEAIGDAASSAILVGAENSVVSLGESFAAKIGIAAVIKCRMDDAPTCGGPNNLLSSGIFISAQPETGFESAIKLSRSSIMVSSAQRATVLDLGDLDPAANEDTVLLRLPGGREITIAQFIRVLDARP